jgi:DNA-binding NtrC family response regulator
MRCRRRPKGGRVTVRAARDGDALEVVVQDTGPGIPAAALPHIWEPFYSGREGGTGLGLSIVRSTVEHHGGTIVAESPAGGGTRMHVRLPVAASGRGFGGRMNAARLRILVVDDEAAQRQVVSEILADEGHETETASSGSAALERLRAQPFDLVLTDLRMPQGDGLELLREGRKLHAGLEIILMTAYASVSTAVEAMKAGAADYLQKPFQKDELIQRVRRLAERRTLQRENERLRAEVAPRLYGESAPMQKLMRHIERLAAVPGDVLVTGESGTGKELIARALHYGGPRAGGPFVPVNCAAIAEGIAESEIFGHEKGAFTHAVAARAGRFEQADGGTLFLDEISSMPAPLQAKLLRVVQDRVVERVGASRTRHVDVRVVAASNRDLRALVRDGLFRDDLYHRLNVHEVHVPPLRERSTDVQLLAEHFRDRAAARFGIPTPAFSPELLRFLLGYPFPGNVRELEHLIDKMVVLSDGEPLGIGDLPHSVRAAWREFGGSDAEAHPTPDAAPHAGRVRPEELLADGPIQFFDVEKRLLAEAIRRSGGNLSEAARQLGLSYKTLRYRAGKFGLVDDSTT